MHPRVWLACFLFLGLFGACSDSAGTNDNSNTNNANQTNGNQDAQVELDATPSSDATVPCTAEDLVNQEICGPGEKCTIVDYTDRDLACTDTGEIEPYLPCAAGPEPPRRPDQCLVGSLCSDAHASGMYLCLPFCAEEGSFCLNGLCRFEVPLPGGAPAFLCGPSDGCDPFAGTGCPVTDACYLVPAAEDMTFCEVAGLGGLESPCTSSFDCLPGMLCFGAPGEELCRTLCRLGEQADCDTAGGEACGNIGSELYGVCYAP